MNIDNIPLSSKEVKQMTGGAMLLIAVAVLLVIGVVASNLKKK